MPGFRPTWARPLTGFALIGLVLTSGCQTAPPPQEAATAEPTATAERRAVRKGRLQTTTFVDNVELPASMTFAPDGRMFFVEVFAGRIRVVENGVLRPEPLATFTVQQGSEGGLLGIALVPDFATNHFMYAYYSEPEPS